MNISQPKLISEKFDDDDDTTTTTTTITTTNNNNNNNKTGTISKTFRKYVSNIPGNHEVKELQKIRSHIGHCTHSSESANVKVQ